MSSKILVHPSAIQSLDRLPFPRESLLAALASASSLRQLKKGLNKKPDDQLSPRTLTSFNLIPGNDSRDHPIHSARLILEIPRIHGVKVTIALQVLFQSLLGESMSILKVMPYGRMSGDLPQRIVLRSKGRQFLGGLGDIQLGSGKLFKMPEPRAMLGEARRSVDGDLFNVLKGELASTGIPGYFKIPKAKGKPHEPLTGISMKSLTGSPAPRGLPPPTLSARKRASERKSDADEVKLWFCTNRNLVKLSDLHVRFGSELSKELHYGTCRVWIDGERPKGGFYKLWDRFKEAVGQGSIVIKGITRLEEAHFWLGLRESLFVQGRQKSLLLFVHGYCNTFASAARTAAVLARDACRGYSEVAFFSWPSHGAVSKYLADTSRTEASEGAFLTFLRRLLAESGAESIHIVAHSMGARLVMRTLEKMKSEADRGLKISNLIFASPDVERDLFLRVNGETSLAIARRVLYVSDRDKALKTSKGRFINDSERAGLRPPWTVATNLETIDVSMVDLSANGHRAIREAPAVLDDLFRLTTQPADPGLRGLRKGEVIEEIQTWTFPEERR